MDNLTEIKKKLNEISMEYKKNKSQLSGEKTKPAAKLIVELTFSNNVSSSDIASELARFSADVVNVYFESLTKSSAIPLEMLDDVLKEFLLTDKDVNKSQHYVQKFVFAITTIIKNYKDKALKSTQLPRLVAFIARFAVKSEKNKSRFHLLINNTMGGIFMLDYTCIKKGSLTNIWNATNNIFPDIKKAKYESFIVDWAKKYGFIKGDTLEAPTAGEQTVRIEKVITSNETSEKDAEQAEMRTITDSNADSDDSGDTTVPLDDSVKEVSKEVPVSSSDDSKSTAPETADIADAKKILVYAPRNVYEKESASEETAVKKLYISLKRDMDNEQQSIITTFTDIITPIGKAVEAIQGEISKSRELGAENVSLKTKIEDLEHQLSEQRSKLQAVNQLLSVAKADNDDLREQIATLESQNAELDSKLNDAYTINNRESSLEAEKIRSELKNAFAFLYEDWLEYEFSDVSEDNYESLQAIIKKIFRSLERNGIDFKGNN